MEKFKQEIHNLDKLCESRYSWITKKDNGCLIVYLELCKKCIEYLDPFETIADFNLEFIYKDLYSDALTSQEAENIKKIHLAWKEWKTEIDYDECVWAGIFPEI